MIPACNFTSDSCSDLTELRIASGKLETRVETLETSQTKIERRLDQLMWFLMVIFSTSAGTLALLVFKK
jgi:chaperonin cofactor prefoldin